MNWTTIATAEVMGYIIILLALYVATAVRSYEKRLAAVEDECRRAVLFVCQEWVPGSSPHSTPVSSAPHSAPVSSDRLRRHDPRDGHMTTVFRR